MASPTKRKTKPTRHETSGDRERDAIRAGLRRAVQREQAIQQLSRALSRQRLSTELALDGLLTKLAARAGQVLVSHNHYAELTTRAEKATSGEA